MTQNRKEGRIFLTGFMGSGKSTIGPILANTLGYSFVDIDAAIEHSTGLTINRIFSERGEAYFRETEVRVLTELCDGTNIVVALGGGTITDPAALSIVTRAGILVYLKASPEKLMYRLRNKTNRPMLFDARGERLDPESMKTRMMDLFRHREVLYEKADITVVSGDQPVGLTVDEIVRRISRHHA